MSQTLISINTPEFSFEKKKVIPRQIPMMKRYLIFGEVFFFHMFCSHCLDTTGTSSFAALCKKLFILIS